ncbi:hypothetical protein DPMN_079914 [Dreissena polymorpha]|uniref:Uncharacterized protein n=1 Tax=Dreissena polymorpha TaxID=45954 RepID=A0A9D4BRC6_DREPO|nr:hypothetical protein DPMN_079914 [Dreissena polymorpha]
MPVLELCKAQTNLKNLRSQCLHWNFVKTRFILKNIRSQSPQFNFVKPKLILKIMWARQHELLVNISMSQTVCNVISESIKCESSRL